MSYHQCKQYFPKNPKVGEEHKCVCWVIYVCVRRWPWPKWNKVKEYKL